MIRYFFLFFLCLVFIAGYTQTNQQYIFLHSGTQDGLLSNETQAVVQDNQGYIWIASKNGLQRYDGHRFVDFKHVEGDSTTIPHNYVTQLVIDKKNRLWLSTANNKLGYFDIKRFVFYEVTVKFNGQLQNKVEGLFKVDLQKNILFILHKDEAFNNVLSYNEQKNEFDETDKRFKLPVEWSVYSFSVDSLKHNYWIATNKGLIKFNPQKNSYSYRDHNQDNDAVIGALQSFMPVENTLLDYDGNFWMNLTNADRRVPHLIKYDASTKQVHDYSKEITAKSQNAYNDIRSIKQPQKGPVWITGRGVFILAANKLNFINSNLPGQYSIHYEEIRGIHFDREHNCWISTNDGIYRMNILNTGFKYIDNKKYNRDSIYTPDVVDFVQLPNGNILTASWGGGLFEYDSDFNSVKSEIVQQGDSKQEKLIWSIHRRANGDIWRTNQDGYLYIYHASSNTTERLHLPVFENKTIRQIAEDRNGNIWLGTQAAIIKWTQKDNTFKLIKRTNAGVYRLYTDKAGDVWALAEVAMKFNVDTDSVQLRYISGKADGKHLLSGEIVDILQFNDSVYIIASEGLNFVDVKNDSIRYFTAADGLPTDYISNIILDKARELWIFTENGVCNRDFEKHLISIYNIEDGIFNSAFTPTSSVLLNDGRIAVGTIHDVLVFDPAKIDNYSTAKPVVEITGISIMNKSVNADSLLSLHNTVLDYTKNSIGIQFSTLSYRNNYGIVYKMEGLDKDWINDDGRGETFYTYLPPGNYVFKVGIDDADGPKNIKSFKFTIAAPFYKTFLFYLLLVTVVALILWRINRERIKRIKDILMMRSNIGKELHNEVSSTLKKISVLSEIAAMKADGDPEQSKNYIHEIKIKSRSTVVAMDDVMWSIDPANDSMVKITERMHEIADAVHHEHNKNISIDISPKTKNYRLSMKERLEFMLLYKKALLMLTTHTHAKQISVTLESRKDDLLLKLLADNEVVNKFNGRIEKALDDIKNRAAEIQCEIDLQASDSFTAFTAIIKHR